MKSYRLFGFLLFLSAFLLFIIQPLSARILLPILGGTPAIWTTSMLFFQLLLLCGYMWAHINIRFFPSYVPPILQIFIISIGFFFINWTSEYELSYSETNLTLWQLKTMFLMVGIPYLALATNAPLYQAIFERIQNKANSNDIKTPYSLYSISNVGSFLALLSYPFIIEPFTTISAQTELWSYGYMILCLLVLLSAVTSFYKQDLVAKKSKTLKKHTVSVKDISLWLVLSFIPVSLMLSVTSYVTIDIASVPLLWIIPLSFYIASFVMAFSDPPSGLARNENLLNLVTFFFIALILIFSFTAPISLLWGAVALHYIGFLFVTTLCHLKLSQIKPHPSRLTLFFLVITIGGCIAGIFHSFFVHKIFVVAIEYFIMLWFFCLFMALRSTKNDEKQIASNAMLFLFAVINIIIFCLLFFIENPDIQAIMILILSIFFIIALFEKRIFLLLATIFIVLIVSNKINFSSDIVHISRNNIGTLIVRDVNYKTIRQLVHGTTVHGIQALPINDNKPKISSYYHPKGPLGDVFSVFNTEQTRNLNRNIAVLGLGVGTVACYSSRNDNFHFYELDQDVIDIALNPEFFTYLSSCTPTAKVTVGDARFNIAKAKKGSYDMIIVDAFSSDSVPTHLLTVEALEIYMNALKDDGLLVFHTSNRYFYLEPIIYVNASLIDREAIYKYSSRTNPDPLFLSSSYAIIPKDETILETLKTQHKWKNTFRKKLPQPWTDDYINIFSVMR